MVRIGVTVREVPRLRRLADDPSGGGADESATCQCGRPGCGARVDEPAAPAPTSPAYRVAAPANALRMAPHGQVFGDLDSSRSRTRPPRCPRSGVVGMVDGPSTGPSGSLTLAALCEVLLSQPRDLPTRRVLRHHRTDLLACGLAESAGTGRYSHRPRSGETAFPTLAINWTRIRRDVPTADRPAARRSAEIRVMSRWAL